MNEVREKTLSSEESDILQRSNKNFKRVDCEGLSTSSDVSMVPNSCENIGSLEQLCSYSHAARGFGGARNPLFEGEDGEDDIESEDDQGCEEEERDGSCPIIRLSKEEKRRIRIPWKNSLIIKLFDKKLGYEVLMRRLKAKWSLKGEIALTDVGHAYYVVRFSNLDD